MKNKLWIFGDSLSVGFNVDSPNSLFPKEYWWCNILADKLDMECINTAGSGNDRVQILYKWLTNWNDIKKNDIVIYQLGFEDRYNTMPIELSISEIQDAVFKRYGNENPLKAWNDNSFGFHMFQKVVLNWGNDLNIHFWNVKSDWKEYNIITTKLVAPNGKMSLYEDWLLLDNNLKTPNDGHFNKISHKMIADSFYSQLKNYKKN